MSGMLPHFVRRHYGVETIGLHTFDLPEAIEEAVDKTITIRLADNDGERSNVNMLINRKYARRGYGSGHKAPINRNCVTFTASSKASVIGTMSFTVDSNDGLACDKTFKDEVDALRATPGVKLCELSKFAFDTSKPNFHLLASLIHIIFIYQDHHYNCTDAVIEVNPRHRRFYNAMLGFELVCAPRTNEAVGAPSYLMRLNLAEMRRLIDEHKADPSASAHSLYGYFFSKKEELGIYGRLVRPEPEPQPIRHGNIIAAGAERVRKLMASHRQRIAVNVGDCPLEPAVA